MSVLWPCAQGSGAAYICARPDAQWSKTRARSLCILGSTGSIGRNALKVLESLPGFFRLEGLACARNIQLLAEQALRWRPGMLAVQDAERARELQSLLRASDSSYSPEILCGSEGYAALAASEGASTVLSAQVGVAGLCGTLAAAFAGKVICLANKESLVVAGELLRLLCARFGAVILPVDSEHNALFECLAGRQGEARRLLLTASGGPFLGKKRSELARVTASEALRHPRWQMGAKISIDSATLMNKGLELIEAVRLFGFAAENVSVLIHPQSIVHSLVEFADRSLLAQLSQPDMRLPLAQCLCWPEAPDTGIAPLDLLSLGSLGFYPPDEQTFACLGLARRALAMTSRAQDSLGKIGISPACVILNGANEAAVELFLAGRCAFLDIPASIEAALNQLDLGQLDLNQLDLDQLDLGQLEKDFPKSGGEKPPRLELDSPGQGLSAADCASLALNLAEVVAALDRQGRQWAAEWIATQAEAKC